MSLSGMIDRIDDWINPIVVKELRQAVKSRLVTVMLLLFLGIQLLIVTMFLLFEQVQTGDLINSRAGAELFQVLQAIMLGTCMVLIPAWAAIRLSNERSDTNVDLLFVSTLRPSSIISGKLFSALVLAILVFSCCAPFLTFTYLLRGIDIPTVLFVLGMDVLAVLFSTQVGLFLAVIPTSRAFKMFLFLGAAILLIWSYAGLVAFSSFLLRDGVSSIPSFDFWPMVGVSTLTTLFSTGLLFCWSVALISPPSANRALLGRIFLVASWLVLGAACLVWSLYLTGSEQRPVFAWMGCAVFLFCIQFLISINERDSWGARVARTIPRNWLLRCLAFLFYSGSAGGVLLSVIGGVLTLLVGLYWQFLFPRFHGVDVGERVLVFLAVIGLYVFCYGMTAVQIRVHLLRDRFRILYNWILSFLLLGVGSAVPWLMLVFVDFNRYSSAHEIHWWMLPNPFDALYRLGPGNDYVRADFAPVCFLFLGVWSLSLTALSVSWVGQQIARFHPPTPRVRSKVPELAERPATLPPPPPESVMPAPVEAG